MIAIVDYGMGNLRSVQKGLEKAGYQAVVVRDPEALPDARGVVLPGVGSFGDTMKNLKERGFAEVIPDLVASGRPFLGICVGLQVLFESGEEMGTHRGLGILAGRVRRFTGDLKIPHMGWNQVFFKQDNPLFKGIPDGSYFYFVHSYYAEPADPEEVCGVTCYGAEFASAVARGNLFAVQFHPEKSSDLGLRVLANFGELVESC